MPETISLSCALAEAEDDIANGRLVSNEEMKIRIEADFVA
jgi:hypothetical protein